MIGRRSFLGALASMVVGGRWLRPQAPVAPVLMVSVRGFSVEPPLPPVYGKCTVTTTWASTFPALVPGDVISLLMEGRRTLFTMTSSSEHGRKMTLREL